MRWLVLLLVGACTSHEDEPPINIDVVVSSSSVVVYPKNDLNCVLGGSADRVFPDLGECASISDGFVLQCEPGVQLESCLDEVSVDGVVAYIGAFTDYAYPFSIDTPVGADSMLSLHGCGLDAQISLSATDLPVPSLTGEIDADGFVSAQWTATRPYESTMVRAMAGFGGRMCRVSGDLYTFDVPTGIPGQTLLTAQPLLPAETHLEDTSTIRVWRGDDAVLRL